MTGRRSRRLGAELVPSPGPRGRHSRCLRDDLLDELEPLSAQLGKIQKDPGHVPARARQARNNFRRDRVGLQIQGDDGDGRRRFPDGIHAGGGRHEDCVRLETDELGGDVGQPIHLARWVAEFDRKIPAVDVTVVLQPLLEGGEDFSNFRARRRRPEEPDPSDSWLSLDVSRQSH